MTATFWKFKGIFASWDALFSEAAAFATALGPGRVISISHSEDENDGVVVVWYWATAEGRDESARLGAYGSEASGPQVSARGRGNDRTGPHEGNTAADLGIYGPDESDLEHGDDEGNVEERT